MRRALGLDGEGRLRPPPERTEQPQPRNMERFTLGGHKRRFVQDGEVPVMLVHGLTAGRRSEHADSNPARTATAAAPTNRLEVAETALAAEIASRDRAEKALVEAQAVIHDLRTKLGHADLARQEAVATLLREREAAAELRVSLREALEQVEVLGQRVPEHVAEHVPTVRRGRPPRAEAAPTVAEPPKRRGRKPGPRMLGVAAHPGTPAPPAAAGDGVREPKPVRWWLASKRSAKKR